MKFLAETMKRCFVLATVSLLAAAVPGSAADQPGPFSIEGHVSKPLHLSAHDLMAMPKTAVTVSFIAQGKTETSKFFGVPLLALITQAGVVDGPGPEKRAHFNHAIEVTGRDGFAVTLSIGEMDPEGEDKAILIAYEREGQPPLVPVGSVRLVVPGDKHGVRSVRDVVKIEVK